MLEVHRAIHAGSAVFVFQPISVDIVHSEQLARPGAVFGDAVAAGQFIAGKVASLDAGPVRDFIERQRLAAEDEAVPGDAEFFDVDRRVLELRLARYRIDHWIDQRPDARVGGILTVPVDRHEHVAARDATAMLHARYHRSPA